MPIVKRKAAIRTEWGVLSYIIFAALYCFLVFHDPTRSVPSRTVAVASYYEPDWLLTLTIIIPRLLMWYLGFRAVYNILVFRDKVKGALYKSALNSLARGLIGVVITVIILRTTQSLAATLSTISIGLILVIIYALLIIIAVSYGLIARGAKNLQKLEDL